MQYNPQKKKILYIEENKNDNHNDNGDDGKHEDDENNDLFISEAVEKQSR